MDAGGTVPAGLRRPPAGLPGSVGGNQRRQRGDSGDDHRTPEVRRDQRRPVQTATSRLPAVQRRRRRPVLRGDHSTDPRLATESL